MSSKQQCATETRIKATTRMSQSRWKLACCGPSTSQCGGLSGHGWVKVGLACEHRHERHSTWRLRIVRNRLRVRKTRLCEHVSNVIHDASHALLARLADLRKEERIHMQLCVVC